MMFVKMFIFVSMLPFPLATSIIKLFREQRVATVCRIRAVPFAERQHIEMPQFAAYVAHR
jgi:hypothetical protein